MSEPVAESSGSQWPENRGNDFRGRLFQTAIAGPDKRYYDARREVTGMVFEDPNERRAKDIAAAIRRESRPTRNDVPKICPKCGVEACFGEQCVKCWKLEMEACFVQQRERDRREAEA